MSITSCFLLFLLCLSLHACSARRLGAVYSKNRLEKKLHFPIKSDMKNGFEKNSDVVLQAKSTSSKELLSIQEESNEESHADDDDTQKLEDADVISHKSVVSVSWRVPHGKRGEKHPGFNLDYSPPKTHPPSHN